MIWEDSEDDVVNSETESERPERHGLLCVE
jgi:hypothetical protein